MHHQKNPRALCLACIINLANISSNKTVKGAEPKKEQKTREETTHLKGLLKNCVLLVDP